ncbi:MAG: hypothetical protein KGM24_13070 [Elusimicrobia bacterium]|nr:hypothetical protein [Elusimicrobiota bacterium]
MSAVLLLLLAAAPARAAQAPAHCPRGTHRVTTDDPYDPFRCEKDGSDGGGAIGALKPVDGPKGFEYRPRCPRGTRAVATNDSLQPYRCVATAAMDGAPQLVPLAGEGVSATAESDGADKVCPGGKVLIHTVDPLKPYVCVSQSQRLVPVQSGTFVRYTIHGKISFEYAPPFRIEDSWKDSVPTLYLALDRSARGKPVTITITHYEQDQTSYQEMGDAIQKDFDWLGARDGGLIPVAGRRARVTYVPGDTRSVYLPVSRESYYSFVYSAPADAYETYLPVFQRLLETLRLGRAAR